VASVVYGQVQADQCTVKASYTGLTAGARYTVTLPAGSVHSVSGDVYNTEVSWGFTTAGGAVTVQPGEQIALLETMGYLDKGASATYRISLPANGTLKATLSTGSTLRAYLYLHAAADPSNYITYVYAAGGETKELVRGDLAAGDYLLRVYVYSRDDYGPYSLKVWDTFPPVVKSTDPRDGATWVNVKARITVTFNEAIEPGPALSQCINPNYLRRGGIL